MTRKPDPPRQRRTRAQRDAAPAPGAGPARPPRRGPARSLPPGLLAAWPLALALLAAIVVHAPALATWFAQDDVTFIARARGIVPTPWSFARPLSEGVVWRVLVALFGLNPLPYHVFNFALHLLNVALVYMIGMRLIGSRAAACAAAVLFGTSGIAFTPLHWISCLVELLVTTFSLSAFLVFLRARAAAAEGRPATGLLWTSAALVFAALVSKENAILLPAVFAVALWRLGPAGGARLTALVPAFTAAALYATAFLATLRTVHYIGSEAYAMSGESPHLAYNLFTYLRWLVSPHVLVRDEVAAADPGALLVGVVVLFLVQALLWALRGRDRHPEEVGAAWFVVLLLPVLPLAHHTYLYYLYLPLAGACWLLAAAGARLLGTRPLQRSTLARVIVVLVVGAIAGNEMVAVRGRERAMLGTLPLDKTMRESLMLRNAITDLRRSNITPGDSIAFVNPAPLRRLTLGGQAAKDEKPVYSYTPLEGALRGGQAIEVFFPGVTYLGFGRSIPPDWESAEVFLYQDEGTLRSLGRGARSLAELGLFTLRTEQWAAAESLFARSVARGDTLPDAIWGMVAADYFQNRRARAMASADMFLRRWPDDPRAPQLAQQLRGESLMVASGQK